MNYKVLNDEQRKRMKQIIHNDFEMEWEEPDFFDTLLGKLPSVRHSSNEKDVQAEITTLKRRNCL